jgi:hypothetical protein
VRAACASILFMHPLLGHLKNLAGRASAWLLAMKERGWVGGAIVTVIYGAFLTWVHSHHEFWRDEVHTWSAALVADGPWDILFGDRRYDGHPPLWYFAVEIAAVFGRGVVGLHVVTVLLSTAATYILYQHGRLPRVLRLFIPYTYLWFYEYGVMSRSYTLGLALLFLFCATHRPRRPRYVASSIVLVLLGMTSVFAFIEAGALVLYLFLGGLRLERRPAAAVGVKGMGAAEATTEWAICGFSARWAVGVAIFVAGAAFTAVLTMPPKDGILVSWNTDVTLDNVRAAGRLFWLTMFPDARDWLDVAALGERWPSVASKVPFAAVALFLAALLALRRSRLLACVYALALTAMVVFQQVKYGMGVRHSGHYFLFFLACGWLAARARARPTPLPLYSILVGLMVLVQIPSMMRATRADIERPFSTALDAANILRPRLTPDTVIFGGHAHVTSTVAAYLDRDIIMTATPVPRRLVVNNSQWTYLDLPTLLRLAAEEAGRGRPVILLLIQPLTERHPNLETTLIHVTGDPIAPEEKYWIYEARTPKAKPEQTPGP